MAEYLETIPASFNSVRNAHVSMLSKTLWLINESQVIVSRWSVVPNLETKKQENII